jgi:hypothetical protein
MRKFEMMEGVGEEKVEDVGGGWGAFFAREWCSGEVGRLKEEMRALIRPQMRRLE